MIKSHRVAYLFLLPAVISFLVFTVVPVIMVGRLSLFKTNYIFSEWVGLKHYVTTLTDPVFYKSIINSLLFSAFLIPLGVGFPLMVALSVFESGDRWQNYVRFIFYVPSLAGALVMGSIWKWIFDYRKGVINHLLGLIGIDRIMWFGYQIPAIAMISFMVAAFWMGSHLLMFMAVMRSVPLAMIDTARVDGASWGQIKRRIIIPLMSPWILFQILLSIIASFQIWESIWVMTGGGPNHNTSTVLFYIYDTAFIDSHYGRGSAQSILMMLVLIALAMIQRKVQGKEEGFV